MTSCKIGRSLLQCGTGHKALMPGVNPLQLSARQLELGCFLLARVMGDSARESHTEQECVSSCAACGLRNISPSLCCSLRLLDRGGALRGHPLASVLHRLWPCQARKRLPLLQHCVLTHSIRQRHVPATTTQSCGPLQNDCSMSGTAQRLMRWVKWARAYPRV